MKEQISQSLSLTRKDVGSRTTINEFHKQWAEQEACQDYRNYHPLNLKNVLLPFMRQDNNYKWLVHKLQTYNKSVESIRNHLTKPTQYQLVDKTICETIYRKIGVIGQRPSFLQKRNVRQLAEWAKSHANKHIFQAKPDFSSTVVLQDSTERTRQFLTALTSSRSQAEIPVSKKVDRSTYRPSNDELEQFCSFVTETQPTLGAFLESLCRKKRLYNLTNETIFQNGRSLQKLFNLHGNGKDLRALGQKLKMWSRQKQSKEEAILMDCSARGCDPDGKVYIFSQIKAKTENPNAFRSIKRRQLDQLRSRRNFMECTRLKMKERDRERDREGEPSSSRMQREDAGRSEQRESPWRGLAQPMLISNPFESEQKKKKKRRGR